jgi:hypothetical protein
MQAARYVPAADGCADEASVRKETEAVAPRYARYFAAAAQSQLTSSIFHPSLQVAADPVV